MNLAFLYDCLAVGFDPRGGNLSGQRARSSMLSGCAKQRLRVPPADRESLSSVCVDSQSECGTVPRRTRAEAPSPFSGRGVSGGRAIAEVACLPDRIPFSSARGPVATDANKSACPSRLQTQPAGAADPSKPNTP